MHRRRWTSPVPAERPSRRLHGAQLVLAGFAAAVAAGTALLMLPISRTGSGGMDPLPALFTATSAVCVTGLNVVDTERYWTGFGQVVIVVLIQLGGLGIASFASVVGLAMLGRLSIRSKLTVNAESRGEGLAEVGTVLFSVVRISLVVEAVVAVLLTARFALGGEALPRAAWLGVFHAVSSFNNAGFSLFGDRNLTAFAGDPFVCLPIAIAIILGGLGFPVIVQLLRYAGTVRLWTMNTRLVLWGTALLLVGGTLCIAVLEWSNPRTLGPLDWPAKLLAAFFQSVQTRTAGFNTVDIGGMHQATLLGMDILMFIGSGPASTGGGIKITTFGVLLFIIWTELRGEAAVNVFGKRLSRAVHRQAISVALLSVAVVTAGTVALLLVSPFDTHQVFFEAISAFATVGLTTGITPHLPAAGQLVLVALMFVGRLGPVTLGAALALRRSRILYELPKERPVIG
jgi:potassium uptake TrkH family protein